MTCIIIIIMWGAGIMYNIVMSHFGKMHKNLLSVIFWGTGSQAKIYLVGWLYTHTSHFKINLNLIKFPRAVIVGHLAAVLGRIRADGIEDQHAGRLSKLCPVLQVTFWEKRERGKKNPQLYNSWLQESGQEANGIPSRVLSECFSFSSACCVNLPTIFFR